MQPIKNTLSKSRQLWRVVRSLPLYPLLLAIYPILFLYNHNISELSFGVLATPILIALVLLSVAMLLVNIILRNWHKTSFLIFIVLLIFYFYQPLVLQLPHLLAEIGGVELTRGKVVLPIVSISFITLAVLVYRKSFSGLTKIAQPLNLILAILLGYSVFQIGQVEISRIARANTLDDQVIAGGMHTSEVAKPDVYYFVFDRYAGEKTLSDYYKFDNSHFLNQLTERGFYVASDSHTNYPSTELSIASSLSMDYLPSSDQAGRKQDFTTDVYPRIWNSQAVKYFKEMDYKYYQVSSRYMPTAYSNVADKQFIPTSKSKLNLDEFSVQLLQGTMVNVIGKGLLDSVVNLDYYHAFLNAHNYQREIMPRVVGLPGPKVVFTHVLLPHDPHVVDENCSTIDESSFTMSTDLPAYLDQLQCANKLAISWIDLIMKQAKGNAIVILQGDEGPYPIVHKLPHQKSFETATDEAILERTRILNAYYFPDRDYSGMYQGITPVNSFRVILQQYFDYDVPNLEDRVNVFPNPDNIFDFIDVTDRVNEAESLISTD